MSSSPTTGVDLERGFGDFEGYETLQQILESPPLLEAVASASVGRAIDFDVLFPGLDEMAMVPEGSLSVRGPAGSDEGISYQPAGNDLAENTLELDEEQNGQTSLGRFDFTSTVQRPWDFPLDGSDNPPLKFTEQGLLDWYRRLDISDHSVENISCVFIYRICEALCIVDTPTGNPWRQIVWPLAQKHPALYHAVAAMTCFSALPRLRADGLRHLETSVQELSTTQHDSMSVEAMATTLLALAMAQTWYYPRSYNGTRHLKKARDLIQALSTSFGTRPANECPTLKFLTNTWMYMDVLTRLTCPNEQSDDSDRMVDLISATSDPDPGLYVDPLMGCANTLFPLIGRVADLVSHVRSSLQKTNSPAIVSAGTELMTAIDRWTPSPLTLDLPCITSTITPGASDLYQTANAYKWATLLLLCQAVPELPCQMSHADIARKVLVFIATVPLSSKAVFFPIFPLMAAGCEPLDAEDRDWVRARWQSLSTFNGSGIADRCLEMTQEVWRRRDEAGIGQASEIAGGIYAVPGWERLTAAQQPATGYGSGSGSGSGYGARMVTPERCLNVSVKSESHWLSVMREWGWEGRYPPYSLCLASFQPLISRSDAGMSVGSAASLVLRARALFVYAEYDMLLWE